MGSTSGHGSAGALVMHVGSGLLWHVFSVYAMGQFLNPYNFPTSTAARAFEQPFESLAHALTSCAG